MNLSNISTPVLLSYSTILENIISTNLEIQGEVTRSVTEGFCQKEEVEKIYNKSAAASFEADNSYAEIQKELDLRMKRDLGMKLGIRKSQSIIKEFDSFINEKHKKLQGEMQDALALKDNADDSNFVENNLPEMKAVKDDSDK